MTVPTPQDRAAPEMRQQTTAVRQGVTLGVMRWVLGISLAAAVIGLVAARFLA